MSMSTHLPEPAVPKGPWSLFLDIDGTLLEHAAHPDAVVVSEELRMLLTQLEAQLDGALAFITGRPIAAVDHLFQPLRLRAAGLYGLEHRLARDGPVEAAVEPADIAALAKEIATELDNADVYIERKGPILAIHTRAAPHLLRRATRLVEQALDKLPAGYRVLAGNAGVELMPLEAAKGAAIRRFMQIPAFRGRRPVFLGDDTSDENGFEVVNELDGISVRIKPYGSTAAPFALAGVDAALAWLDGMSRRETVGTPAAMAK
ncbi:MULTISPECIES: trehalose-phosphatase [Mesorhizobium]|uniref:Trehalose 6-phosphate phosphatase n=1 Tax=Rhizobium loti TaxID=381 RepID=A0A6M7U3L6_RHILI|nr:MULTISPECIES: trehalose-phosphatase [Mesorhizobium]KRB19993.1 trehalose phosphatase [Mesorhizobium sp. Root172]OBQ72862.1 trehalose-phosphatase [Mesorhizobium loti]QKC71522.1 trehalose-phosphatase [Mesorhizobium loti]QKC90438.1 trehalose-phosphatase [Mesorhizobium sp. NZP2234]